MNRWAMLDKHGGILGVGATAGKFDLKRMVFVGDNSYTVWESGGRFICKLHDGNFARILRRGVYTLVNVDNFEHTRIRKYKPLKRSSIVDKAKA